MKIQRQADLSWTPEDFFNDPELNECPNCHARLTTEDGTRKVSNPREEELLAIIDRHTPERLRRFARVICNHSLECAGDLPSD